MVNSLRKGKRFEREVVRVLREITKCPNWKRVPMSGAYATKGAKNRVFRGDIFYDVEHWEGANCKKYTKVVVECKTTRKTLFISSILNEKSLFWDWVRQVEKEAKNNYWILFFRDGSRRLYALRPRNWEWDVYSALSKHSKGSLFFELRGKEYILYLVR